MSAVKLTKKLLLEKAAGLNLKGISKLRKEELIHAIQSGEGNAPCFGKIENCGEHHCLFAADCQG